MSDFCYISQSTGLPKNLYIGDFIAEGSFGAVHALDDDEHLVCKKVPIKENLDQGMTKNEVLKATINELHALKKMELLEGYLRKGNFFYIIIKKVKGHPLCNCSLYSPTYFPAAFQALRNCHRRDITHFDTHGKNFLAQSKEKVTVIDFGSSQNATFINVFLDCIELIFPDYIDSKAAALKYMAELLMRDYINYITHNKSKVFIDYLWWGAILYGALYGMPLFMLPSQFFYDYLKSKILYQVFYEIRTLALSPKEKIAHLCYFVLPDFIFNVVLKYITFIKHIFKPIYLLAAYIPYSQVNQLYEKILSSRLVSESTISPTTPLLFRAAFLYHPIKASAQYIDDVLIQPFQPECVAKARADLYFKYHPKLYLKAAGSKLSNAIQTAYSVQTTNRAAKECYNTAKATHTYLRPLRATKAG